MKGKVLLLSMLLIMSMFIIQVPQTKASPPQFSNINPADGATGVSLPGCVITIQINDSEGDQFNYSWACSDGSYNFASGNTNGTKYLMLCMSGLHECGTTYTWWINASERDNDSNYNNQSFSFTTEDCVTEYTDVIPTNNSVGICPCPDCENYSCVCINGTHMGGNNVNISFYSNYSGAWEAFQNFTNVSGLYCAFFPAEYETQYWWYVNVSEYNNESNYNQTDVYTFTTDSYANCSSSGGACGEIIFTDTSQAWILTSIVIIGGLGIIFADRKKKKRKR